MRKNKKIKRLLSIDLVLMGESRDGKEDTVLKNTLNAELTGLGNRSVLKAMSFWHETMER